MKPALKVYFSGKRYFIFCIRVWHCKGRILFHQSPILGTTLWYILCTAYVIHWHKYIKSSRRLQYVFILCIHSAEGYVVTQCDKYHKQELPTSQKRVRQREQAILTKKQHEAEVIIIVCGLFTKKAQISTKFH